MEQLSSSAITVESRVQQDGNVVTSRGPGTTMELAVALVELLFGKDKADEVSGPLVILFILISLLLVLFHRNQGPGSGMISIIFN